MPALSPPEVRTASRMRDGVLEDMVIEGERDASRRRSEIQCPRPGSPSLGSNVMQQLPTELVLLVLDYLKGLPAIALAGTSRTLRATAVQHESYGVDVHVDHDLSGDVASTVAWTSFTQRLQRVAELSLPVRVQIEIREHSRPVDNPTIAEQCWSTALTALGTAMTRSLVSSLDCYVTRRRALTLLQLLVMPSDRMRTLVFKVCNDREFGKGIGFAFPTTLLGNHAPRLHKVHLRRITLPIAPIAAFARVAEVSLTSDALPLLTTVSTHFPQARQLFLHGRRDAHYAGLLQNPPLPVLDSLRELRLDALSPRISWTNFQRLAAELDTICPNLVRVHLYCTTTWSGCREFVAAFALKVLGGRRIRLVGSFSTMYTRVQVIALTDDAGPPRQIKLHAGIDPASIEDSVHFELLACIAAQVLSASVPYFLEESLARLELCRVAEEVLAKIIINLSPDDSSDPSNPRVQAPWLQLMDGTNHTGEDDELYLIEQADNSTFVVRLHVLRDTLDLKHVRAPVLVMTSGSKMEVSRRYVVACAERHMPSAGVLHLELRNIALVGRLHV